MREGSYTLLSVKDLTVKNLNVENINIKEKLEKGLETSAEIVKNLYESMNNTNCFTDWYKENIDYLFKFFHLSKTFLPFFCEKLVSLKIVQKYENSIPLYSKINCYDEFDNLITVFKTEKGLQMYQHAQYETIFVSNLFDDEDNELNIKQLN
tara:strand:+ start:10290 stop:10745 length:456 start_codon:yes stop_codon:yes gene_type:complete